MTFHEQLWADHKNTIIIAGILLVLIIYIYYIIFRKLKSRYKPDEEPQEPENEEESEWDKPQYVQPLNASDRINQIDKQREDLFKELEKERNEINQKGKELGEKKKIIEKQMEYLRGNGG